LKPEGTLVYSTCTITIAENEGIVAWALKTFPDMVLQSVHERLVHLKMETFATVGYNIDGLNFNQSNKLCRFGCENDFIGFFIAAFTKKKIN
jgi:16S rRNA C967 or C1407 C5-methylase (RsmB/RsmF family)